MRVSHGDGQHFAGSKVKVELDQHRQGSRGAQVGEGSQAAAAATTAPKGAGIRGCRGALADQPARASLDL
eukprot:5831494-Pyramimonas_sp.AAC.1